MLAKNLKTWQNLEKYGRNLKKRFNVTFSLQPEIVYDILDKEDRRMTGRQRKSMSRWRGEGGPQRQPTNILVSKTAPQKAAHTQNRFGSGA